MTTIEHWRYLLDANVLVYAMDPSEPSKQERAQEVLKTLEASGKGILSVQVLGEFFRAVTQRIPQKVLPSVAVRAIYAWLNSWPVLPTSVAAFEDAAAIALNYQLQIWDAVICASAKVNGIQALLSEDMQNGQLIAGVRIINPFHPDFDLAQLA